MKTFFKTNYMENFIIFSIIFLVVAGAITAALHIAGAFKPKAFTQYEA